MGRRLEYEVKTSVRLNMSNPQHVKINDVIQNLDPKIFKSKNQFIIDAIQFYIDNYGKETFVIKKKEKERAEYIRSEDIDDIKEEVIEAATNEATFDDKPEVDYSQKEQKHLITKAVLAPMKAVKKMLVSMELHLDASIDKLDNLAMNVQLDKEKHMENEKEQEQTEPERAEAEQVEAEIVYAPMVAETHEYQYNADAFEARGVDEVKHEAAHKEVSKVREDKAR